MRQRISNQPARIGVNAPSLLRRHRAALVPVMERAAAEPSIPFDKAARAPLSRKLDRDFSHVRVHQGPASDLAARALGARAYTLGRDVHLSREAEKLRSRDLTRLLAHEAVHTLQQGGGAASPRSDTQLSSPSDPAEVEARLIAASITTEAVGALKSPVSRVGAPLIQRDLTGEKAVAFGTFTPSLETKKRTEAENDRDGNPQVKSGLKGTITFKPNDMSPDSDRISLLQTVRNQHDPGGQDPTWSEEEDARRTKEDKKKGILKGFFVDHDRATKSPRMRASDAEVSPYYRDSWLNPADSHDGSKKHRPGYPILNRDPASVQTASLWDFPGSTYLKDAPLGALIGHTWSFETVAKAVDTGFIYGALTWGFKLLDTAGTLVGEYVKAESRQSATSVDALKRFDEFYANPGASTSPGGPATATPSGGTDTYRYPEGYAK